MAWFKRKDKGIQTPTEAKKDIPKGLWYKSPTGKIVDTEELEQNYYVVLKMVITLELEVKNISTFYLMINSKS